MCNQRLPLLVAVSSHGQAGISKLSKVQGDNNTGEVCMVYWQVWYGERLSRCCFQLGLCPWHVSFWKWPTHIHVISLPPSQLSSRGITNWAWKDTWREVCVKQQAFRLRVQGSSTPPSPPLPRDLSHRMNLQLHHYLQRHPRPRPGQRLGKWPKALRLRPPFYPPAPAYLFQKQASCCRGNANIPRLQAWRRAVGRGLLKYESISRRSQSKVRLESRAALSLKCLFHTGTGRGGKPLGSMCFGIWGDFMWQLN